MDLLTQGLLGGALAQTMANKQEVRHATLIGFLSGLLADADVLIQSSTDPLLTLEFHRHFTHSIFFIPIGALIASGLLWFFYRDRLPFKRLYMFSILGYSLSGFIDACTSYGTYLLWPLSDERVAFNIISIIDPVFTLVLLIGFLLTFINYQKYTVRIALAFCALYLVFGFFQYHRAENIALELADTRKHTIEKLVVKPTLGNLILWRSTYISGEEIYIDAIRTGIFSDNRVYKGASVPLFSMTRDMPELSITNPVYRDILRFSMLSDGFLALHPGDKSVVGDLRYSMLPTSNTPLWGLRINVRSQDKPVHFEFFRHNDADSRRRFMNMLYGN